jgi:hypothetical protein
LRWQAADSLWQQVGGSRNWTAAGPAKIPVTEFLAWCKLVGYPRELWKSSWEDLSLYDSQWLAVKHEHDENRRKKDEAKAKQKSKSRK